MIGDSPALRHLRELSGIFVSFFFLSSLPLSLHLFRLREGGRTIESWIVRGAAGVQGKTPRGGDIIISELVWVTGFLGSGG